MPSSVHPDGTTVPQLVLGEPADLAEGEVLEVIQVPEEQIHWLS
jgi:hypothetical protein